MRECECCHTPETETELEERGHGGGWLLCVGGCKPTYGCHRRRYAELTPAVLDALEDAADRAQHLYEPMVDVAEVDAATLHSLIRLARASRLTSGRLAQLRQLAAQPLDPNPYAVPELLRQALLEVLGEFHG